MTLCMQNPRPPTPYASTEKRVHVNPSASLIPVPALMPTCVLAKPHRYPTGLNEKVYTAPPRILSRLMRFLESLLGSAAAEYSSLS
ncbi:hypothetical protein CPB85DRAFT_1331704 [Mucidula mucida]|nr:hypothetical protein CPB85DRAFT_1331704 [Mucidula mucida]